MFTSVLIANRGAIACRIIRTLKAMGIRSIAVFSDADASSRHVREADVAVSLGGGPSSDTYLNAAKILEIARAEGAQAIHPGYGFLSENAGFAEACEQAGFQFIGPSPDNIRAFGHKHTARAFAEAHGVPLAAGSGLLQDVAEACAAAGSIGYPVMLKATAGGGGIGMRVCADEAALVAQFEAVKRMGEASFGDAGVFLERFVARARHIEAQVFGDGTGRVMIVGDRDCSLQRRNQKVIEEAPAFLLPDALRVDLHAAAHRLMSAAKYRSAGTVEFLYDVDRGDYFFLEVNTRLQVEHGVTEQVTGVDLVEWMVRGAAGDYAFLDAPAPASVGHAIQARLYAEDPGADFRPASGLVQSVRWPGGARIETWIEPGADVPALYDPMLAKLIVTADTRGDAVAKLHTALGGTDITGLGTNVDWLRTVASSSVFVTGAVSTATLGTLPYTPAMIRVLSGGAATSLQDWPGRVGLWDVGVPPSGPFDDQNFRLANRILGNDEGVVGIEFTMQGPTLRFESDAWIVLTGADFGATRDGAPVPTFVATFVPAGGVLKCGRAKSGARGYLAVAGGLKVPGYLGSAATFTLGQFGGLTGRTLAAGDVLALEAGLASTAPLEVDFSHLRPAFTKSWTLRVLYGPHGAPDFFTPSDIETLQSARYVVHHNSNRTGIRLDGPKPAWARKDGGEAGLHPSNIHDNAYAIGAVDFTGDMPILLGPDGPSLGGFVCPFVVISADLWKLGQLAAGDDVRFEMIEDSAASCARALQRNLIETLQIDVYPNPPRTAVGVQSPILLADPPRDGMPKLCIRRQGDANILIEYGEIVLDIELRVRVQALLEALQAQAIEGVIECTPGIRSLQVHFDPGRLPVRNLVDTIIALDEQLGALDDFTAPSRIVHLPLSWSDPAIWETIRKYESSVRDDAPWTPSNIEFIRRVNGLRDEDAVRQTVFDASYFVMGLGDVYLGAPVATPLDPRHRLVTTKYNPARTWTPPNVVGIGGAYMCIYGMEGPGGYQLFGRTIQVWNTHRQTDVFVDGKPWLLRFFDQIRFFPVTAEELAAWRRDFPLGRRKIKVEHTQFSIKAYRAFLAENAESITTFETSRNAAFAAERARWAASGEFDRVAALSAADATPEALQVTVPDGAQAVEASFGGSVWQMPVTLGDTVKAGDTVAIIEAMKTECPIEAPISGKVSGVYAAKGQAVTPGAVLLAITPEGAA